VTPFRERLQGIQQLLFGWLSVITTPLYEIFKDSPSQIKEGFHEAWIGLRSKDFPTKRMSVVFYLSLLGLAVTTFGFASYMVKVGKIERARHLEEDRLAIEKEARAEEARKAKLPPPYQSLGTFTLELRENEGVAKTSGLRAAEMEIVVACSELTTCEWLKANIEIARGEFGPLFTPADREKLLSTGGKKAFREEIREALNKLLERRGVSGTVIEVLFPRFIVS
jgi:flagellar basal body-associated protein FliL